jgi:hypothetical protein
MHGGVLGRPVPRSGGIRSNEVCDMSDGVIRDPRAADLDRIGAAGEGRRLEIDKRE